MSDLGVVTADRRLRMVLKSVLVGSAFAVGIVVLFFAVRVLFPAHDESSEHVEHKRGYLEEIASLSAGSLRGPNLVVILFDDLGYGDLGAYGDTMIRTPQLDRLAAAGARFSNGYSASPYCSASRAGLLTGRYAYRSGLDHVLQAPWSSKDLLLRVGGRNRRLPTDEITLAEILSAAGFSTGIIGKWHLGDVEPALPNDRGFDVFYGLLNSNDQGKPTIWNNREVVESHPIDQATLTRKYTERAIDFLETNRERRFFLYLPHTFPHIPLHVGEERRGRSPAGLYGDVVEELDDSIGEVVAAIERLGLAEETLIVVTSDNGPWFQGSPGGSRGRKMDIFEGGMRVPFLMTWQGKLVPGRVIEEPVSAIDLLPTVLELTGLPRPGDRVLDGRSLADVLESGSVPPRRPLFFYQLGVLRAVRSGQFKYHDRHRVAFGNPMDWPWGPTKSRGPWLFDLATDSDESYDATAHHPEEAHRLRKLLTDRRLEDRRNRRGWV